MLVGGTLAMLAVTPALPVGVLTRLLLERTGWRARWLALAALLGPPWRLSWLLLHAQGWQAVVEAWPWWWARLDAWQAIMVCEAPLSVPLGILGAVLAAQLGGRRASGAPWGPATIRQRARTEAREAKRILRRLDDPRAAARCTAPPLAVARADGDLASWRKVTGWSCPGPCGPVPGRGRAARDGQDGAAAAAGRGRWDGRAAVRRRRG